MICVENKTIGEVFDEAVDRYGKNIFLMVPAADGREYHPAGYSITYEQASREVAQYEKALCSSGYGHGHRVAVLIENRPEYLLLKIAFNKLGISCVPVNPDYLSAEIAYLLKDSGVDLAIVAKSLHSRLNAGLMESGRSLPVVIFEEMSFEFPQAISPIPQEGSVSLETEASLIYTSGTTGNPKGCRIGHESELLVGQWYATSGGRISFEIGKERLLNPLPLFHTNGSIFSFFCIMITGNCQILLERFSRRSWWPTVRESGATCIHYLGAIIPVLMSEPVNPEYRNHCVKFGVGAGVEPVLHSRFEERFGFPLIEIWGMTEFTRILTDSEEPRKVGTRAIGRSKPGLEVRVVDDNDRDVALGDAGELLVRHSAETPRKGAFMGYLNKLEETEDAWRGGWFHSGDLVRQDESGMLYFVDRKKNVIRRSGENIAAAEVEACIQECSSVAQVAVMSVEDEIRDEEVFACIVLKKKCLSDETTAKGIFDHCLSRLAYYKSPGWIRFMAELPVTGTQKVLKRKIFDGDEDPRVMPGTFDFRALKVR